MKPVHRNYIEGAWTSTQGTSELPVFNPSTGAVIAHITDSDAEAVDHAVSSARRAQPAWARLPAAVRAEHLRSLSAAIRQDADRLGKLIVQEQGKTPGLAGVEVQFTAMYIDYMAEWARRIEGEIVESDRPNENIFLFRKPLGVSAGILPWNFPFFMVARKLAPALVTGNTIVVKPSEETPLCAVAFAELVERSSLPAGVFNLVLGSGKTGALLSSHRDINLISFTGSVSTGSKIMQAAGVNLTRVNLELGGKAPAIVLADCDLDLTAKAIFESRILNSGQICNCAERVYVERQVADALTTKLTHLMKGTSYGDPSESPDVGMGPLINAAACERVLSLVQDAKSKGAEILTGGRIIDRPGHFFEPTVLMNCNASMNVMRQETFGPVLPLQVVESLDEAISFANDTEYGLTSSIFTTNLNAAMKACRELRFGETYVNREHFEAMQGFHAGRGKSGIGGADGKHGLYEFLETHVVYMQS